MDDELLRQLYHRLFSDPSFVHTRDCTFGDAIILLIHFFAVLDNRSHLWASVKRNWPLWCRALRFPSYSQLMKRLAKVSTQQRIAQLNDEFRARLPRSTEKVCDGKPLVVGGYSKDCDAQRGKVPNGWARGYRLHALIDSLGAIEGFDVTSMEGGEPTAMRDIVQQIDLAGVMVRADCAYDSNPLYQQIASRGGRLIATRKKPDTGLGHGQHHPHRLQAIEELEGEGNQQRLKEHQLHRTRAEQCFAHLTNLRFGIWALPNFVRRLKRVRQWIKTEILLYHLHLALSQSAKAAA